MRQRWADRSQRGATLSFHQEEISQHLIGQYERSVEETGGHIDSNGDWRAQACPPAHTEASRRKQTVIS